MATFLLFFLMAAGALTGCSGGGNSPGSGQGSPGTTAGNYVVTVTGGSASLTSSAAIPLTLQ